MVKISGHYLIADLKVENLSINDPKSMTGESTMIKKPTLEPYVIENGVLTDSSDYLSHETTAIIPEGV